MSYQIKFWAVLSRFIANSDQDYSKQRTSNALAYELGRANIPFKMQVSLPVQYKQTQLDCGYRIDLLIDDKLIVDLKCVEQLSRTHEAQILNVYEACAHQCRTVDQFQCASA